MEYLVLGFFTGLSLILAIGAQNIFVIEQGLKKNGHKYYDEPYLRFKGTKYEQETFFIKDPNENVLEIKTLTANSE